MPMPFASLFKKQRHAEVAIDPSKRKAEALGLRVCAQPRDAACTIDIVFVHGLTGNREKTWTHQTSSCFWPGELLPSNLPSARIFTYGYDAEVAHFFSPASQSRIGNHSKTLLSALANLRELSDTSQRPVIFVVHSLGGLVVEDMLLSAKNSAEAHHRQVLESTEGVAFMGTPHCGSRLADWAVIFTSVGKLVKRFNEPIIAILQPESEVLARIQQEFHTMIRARSDAGKHKLRITCFYEDLDTPGIGAVVPKHSAILPAYTAISLPGNHANMTKFPDAECQGYRLVSSELQLWARDIIRASSSRSEANTSPPLQSSGPFREGGGGAQMTSNYFSGRMQQMGQIFQGNNIGSFRTDGAHVETNRM